jgi:hypothetical protein
VLQISKTTVWLYHEGEHQKDYKQFDQLQRDHKSGVCGRLTGRVSPIVPADERR